MPTRDAVLSIQSQVAYGHVGNSAAVLPLQRLGFDVVPINTVQLAHHPGYGTWRGHQVEAARLDEILTGIEERGVLARCAAVLSGYLGTPEVADVVARAVDAACKARPDALYVCDPVIGDDGPGVFVAAGVPERIRDQLVPLADVVVPNRFELTYLTGRPARTPNEAHEAAAALRSLGPRTVVVTGIAAPDPHQIAVLADAPGETWLVTTPHRTTNLGGGTGDAFSALFLGHYLATGTLRDGLERSVAATYALIECTGDAEELALVAAQDALVAPPRTFPAERLR